MVIAKKLTRDSDMKYFLFSMCLLLACSNSHSATWTQVNDLFDEHIFVDYETISQDGDIRSFWVKREQRPYKSVIQFVQINCEEQSYKTNTVLIEKNNLFEFELEDWSPIARRLFPFPMYTKLCKQNRGVVKDGIDQ